MKHQRIWRLTQFSPHSTAYADRHSAVRTRLAKLTLDAGTQDEGDIWKIRPPILEKRNQWQIKLRCESSRLYMPPAVSDSEENVRPKRVNQLMNHFRRRQNRE